MGGKVKRAFFYRLFSTDHRDIGNCYLGFAVFAGLLGAVFSILLRLGLNENESHSLVKISTFFYSNADSQFLFFFLSSGHALVMIFFMMMPALMGGFANWMVPLLIGCDDVAFPKVNRFAFWMLVFSFCLFALPLFYKLPVSFFIAIAAFHLCCLSLILTFINFITTIITMRAPGMTLIKMPIFVWSILSASFLGLMCLPVLLVATTTPSLVNNQNAEHLPIMLWFLTHPESYMLLLPAFGIVSQVVATFSGRTLIAEKGVVSALIIISLIIFVFWVESLFGAANSNGIEHYFLVALPLISLPIGFILFSWIATLFMGQLMFRTPLLWALGGVLISILGMALTVEIFLSRYIALNEATPIFIAHFHYVVSLSVVFAIFAGWYFWFPKMTGLIIRETTGQLHFVLTFCAVNMIFLSQYFSHKIESSSSFAGSIDALIGWSLISTLGALGIAVSLFVFVYGIIESFVRGQKAGMNPWGKGAVTLEWQLSSPPPCNT